MAENPLEKILRLSTVRTYRRMENGRPQQVRQYTNSRTARGKPAGQQGSGAGQAKRSKLPEARVTWRSLQRGDTVLLGQVKWKVVQTHITQKAATPNRKGTRHGAKTGSGHNTGSGGGVNTKGGGKPGHKGGGSTGHKASTPVITNVLRNEATGKELQIALPESFMVTVL